MKLRINYSLVLFTLFISLPFGTAAGKGASPQKAATPPALARLIKQVDKLEGITWYMDQKSVGPTFEGAMEKFARELGISKVHLTDEGKAAGLNQFASPLYMYIGQKSGRKTWLRIVIEVADTTWLFVNKIKLLVDGRVFEVVPDAGQFKRKSHAGGVTETYDEIATDENIAMMKAIAESKETLVRYTGSDHSVDRKLTKTEKKGIKSILTAYQALTQTKMKK